MMPAPERVFLAVEPIDMRMGIDGLSLLIQQATSHSPFDGTAFSFRNRHNTRIKLLIWDETDVWLCHRRLHAGRFKWPPVDDTVCPLISEQWQWLVTGVDWQRLNALPPAHWRI